MVMGTYNAVIPLVTLMSAFLHTLSQHGNQPDEAVTEHDDLQPGLPSFHGIFEIDSVISDASGYNSIKTTSDLPGHIEIFCQYAVSNDLASGTILLARIH